MRVEVVSDLVCPWCYIGKRRFDNAVAQVAAQRATPLAAPRASPVSSPAATITYRAYQLDPAPWLLPPPRKPLIMGGLVVKTPPAEASRVSNGQPVT